MDVTIIPPKGEEDQTINEFSFQIQEGKPVIFGRDSFGKGLQRRFARISSKHLKIELLPMNLGPRVTNLSKTNPSYLNVAYSLAPTKPESTQEMELHTPYETVITEYGVDILNRTVGLRYGSKKKCGYGWILLSYRGQYQYDNGKSPCMEAVDDFGAPPEAEAFTALRSLEDERVVVNEKMEEGKVWKKIWKREDEMSALRRKGDDKPSTLVEIFDTEELTDGTKNGHNKYYIDLVAPDFEWSFQLVPGCPVKFGCESSNTHGNDGNLLAMADTISLQHLEFTFADDNDPKKGIMVENLTVDRRPTRICYEDRQGMPQMKRNDKCSLTEFMRNGKDIVVPYQNQIMDDTCKNPFLVANIKFRCRGEFYIDGEETMTCYFPSDLNKSRLS